MCKRICICKCICTYKYMDPVAEAVKGIQRMVPGKRQKWGSEQPLNPTPLNPKPLNPFTLNPYMGVSENRGP